MKVKSFHKQVVKIMGIPGFVISVNIGITNALNIYMQAMSKIFFCFSVTESSKFLDIHARKLNTKTGKHFNVGQLYPTIF